MQFGCVIVPEDYALIEAAGYDYVELSNRAVCAMSPNEFTSLRRIVSQGALPCLGLNAYCPPEIRIAGPGFMLNRAREWALRSAERAAELGVRVVGVGSPLSRVLPDGFPIAQAWAQAAEFFAATGEVFARTGIRVCVEALGPCYCNFINRLEEAAKLVRMVDAYNVCLVVDFYNMEHNNQADIPLTPFASDITHAHISDDAGAPQMRWFLRHNKRELHTLRLRRLYETGYRGMVSVEIDLRVDPAEAAASLKMLRDSVMI